MNIAERALRSIAFGARKQLERCLAEIDPDGYYPNCCTEDLRIHIAAVAVAKLTTQRGTPDWDAIARSETEMEHSSRAGNIEG